RFFCSGRSRHTRFSRDWSSDVCSSDLISGEFYRQFALTIAASMILSAVNAMTMTPARAAAIFKNRKVNAHGHLEGQEALPRWGRSEERRVGNGCRRRRWEETRVETDSV